MLSVLFPTKKELNPAIKEKTQQKRELNPTKKEKYYMFSPTKKELTQQKRKQHKTQRIAITNQKGGVGKTTCSVNIAAGLVNLGMRVLLIDFDPQANATSHLGVSKTLDISLPDFLVGSCSFKNVVIKLDNGIHLIPGHKDLAATENELVNIPDGELVLKEKLSGFDSDYDYVLIDTNSALNQLTINSMCYADQVYIPVQAEYLAMEGVADIVEIINMIASNLNDKLSITGVIVTMYDKRNNQSRETEIEIKEVFKNSVFNTTVNRNVKLSEAPAYGQTIFEYSKTSIGSKNYHKLCKEIINDKD
jgi:chromosome partitioning protein